MVAVAAFGAIALYIFMGGASARPSGERIDQYLKTVLSQWVVVDSDYKIFDDTANSGRISISGNVLLAQDRFAGTTVGFSPYHRSLLEFASSIGMAPALWSSFWNETKYGHYQLPLFEVSRVMAAGEQHYFKGDIRYIETVDGFDFSGAPYVSVSKDNGNSVSFAGQTWSELQITSTPYVAGDSTYQELQAAMKDYVASKQSQASAVRSELEAWLRAGQGTISINSSFQGCESSVMRATFVLPETIPWRVAPEGAEMEFLTSIKIVAMRDFNWQTASVKKGQPLTGRLAVRYPVDISTGNAPRAIIYINGIYPNLEVWTEIYLKDGSFSSSYSNYTLTSGGTVDGPEFEDGLPVVYCGAVDTSFAYGLNNQKWLEFDQPDGKCISWQPLFMMGKVIWKPSQLHADRVLLRANTQNFPTKLTYDACKQEASPPAESKDASPAPANVPSGNDAAPVPKAVNAWLGTWSGTYQCNDNRDRTGYLTWTISSAGADKIRINEIYIRNGAQETASYLATVKGQTFSGSSGQYNIQARLVSENDASGSWPGYQPCKDIVVHREQ